MVRVAKKTKLYETVVACNYVRIVKAGATSHLVPSFGYVTALKRV